MSKKVTFILPAEVVANATAGIILGEFNNWDDTQAASLKKQKDGSMKATLTLEAGRTYQYRYLLNDGRWVNDNTADRFEPAFGYHVENCVITVPVEEVVTVETVAETVAAPATVVEIAEAAVVAASTPAKKDDLTKIEGIGKKIAEILAAAGITSFEELAAATTKTLRTTLDNAGSKFKVHDPATWAKQAKLAATGKFDELKKLQAKLKGGK